MLKLDTIKKYVVLVFITLSFKFKIIAQPCTTYNDENYCLDSILYYSVFKHYHSFWIENSFKNILIDTLIGSKEFIRFDDINLNYSKDTINDYAMVKISPNDSILNNIEYSYNHIFFDTANDYTQIYTHKIKIYNIYKLYNNVIIDFIPLNNLKPIKTYNIIRQCFNENFLVLIDSKLKLNGNFMRYYTSYKLEINDREK